MKFMYQSVKTSTDWISMQFTTKQPNSITFFFTRICL